MSDRGSILPLLMGVVALLMLVLGGLTSIAEVTRAQRWLHQVGDQAAVAATTAIDLDRYYRDGATDVVPLDADLARERALLSLGAEQVRLEEFAVMGDEVQLTLSTPIDLVWGWQREISVVVAAKAHH